MLQLTSKTEAIDRVENVENVEATEFINHFNWDVKERKIFNPDGRIIPGFKSLERTDNGKILNVCKESYTPVTNEMFSGFVQKLSDLSGFELKSIDEYQDGKKVLAYLKAPEIKVNSFPIENYLCIGNSHDSTTSLFIANTTNMIRCQNRFSDLKNSSIKISHTSQNEQRLKEAEKAIRLYLGQQKKLYNNFERLQAAKATEERALQFTSHIFDLEPAFDYDRDFENISSRKSNQIADLLEAIEIEANDLGENDFALFNGVTRWTTHIRNQKNGTFGNLFGSNASLNQKALDYLLN